MVVTGPETGPPSPAIIPVQIFAQMLFSKDIKYDKDDAYS